jgi:hypothetical protein
MRDAHAIAGTKAGRLRQLHQTVPLAPAKVGDDAIGDPRWYAAIGDQANHPRRSLDGVPLQDDQDEGIAGKEQSRILAPSGARRSDPQH